MGMKNVLFVYRKYWPKEVNLVFWINVLMCFVWTVSGSGELLMRSQAVNIIIELVLFAEETVI